MTLTYIDVGPFFLPALLIMMAVKFFMVVCFFMHLKFDNRLFSVLFYIGLLPRRRRLRRRPGHVPLLRQLSRLGCGRVRSVMPVASSLPQETGRVRPCDPFRFQAHPEVWLLVAVLDRRATCTWCA